jgi:hypothetical protein
MATPQISNAAGLQRRRALLSPFAALKWVIKEEA